MNEELKEELNKYSFPSASNSMNKSGFVPQDYANEFIDRATIAERKRCAEIARDEDDCGIDHDYTERSCGFSIADAIEKGYFSL